MESPADRTRRQLDQLDYIARFHADVDRLAARYEQYRAAHHDAYERLVQLAYDTVATRDDYTGTTDHQHADRGDTADPGRASDPH